MNNNIWENYDHLEQNIEVHIVKDSLIEYNDTRVTTMLWRVPKYSLAQLNTHRQHSKNVGSSRALSFEKNIKRIRENPYMPHVFQAQHKGMQGDELIEEWKVPIAKFLWKTSMWSQTFFAQMISNLGVSKQYTNRLVEPYMYVDYLVTSTTYENFFKQRDSYHAQLDIQIISRLAKLAMKHSEPNILKLGDAHLPFVTPEILTQYGLYDSIRISVARCARTSYITPGYSSEIASDMRLFNRLINDYHMSPTEHIVFAYGSNGGNFQNCTQFRKVVENYLEVNDDVFDEVTLKKMIESLPLNLNYAK